MSRSWLCLIISEQGPHQRSLLKNLLKDYNRMERPVGNDSHPLTVVFTLSLIQIMDVDEKNQVLTSNMWLRMGWYDHYLQWNQSEHPGVKNLRFSHDQIWTPDILLYNSADDDFDSTFKTNILVNSSGYAEYLPPGIFMSTCNVDVRWFPFDIQKCELKFGSWTYDGWLLDLQMTDVRLVLLQWVAWFLRMKRPGENDDPERPPCAPHLRRCSSGSQSGSIPNPPDPTLHPLHPQNLGSLQTGPLHTGHPHLHSQTSANNNGNLLYMGFQSMDDPGLLSEAVQRNLTSGPPRVAGSPPPHLPSQFCSSPPPPTPNLDTGCPSTVSSGGGFGGGHGGLGGCSTSGIGDPQLQAILEEVRYMADRFREQDETESMADQWKFAGAVIDRLCLVAFSVFNIICTISILMSAPNFVEAISKDFV
ncbi:hypothetical protein WMY93_019724 [Mugilogobius chulae]|uniref:Neurotransmitter-gated ion-channel ligand-binding domain-containing protein n=1 Tax=Mugilogobius chulae TaxID=88201 RepID=A0AAW0NS11_9GOBI